MFHSSQTRGCGFLTIHSRKPTNSHINVPKTFILAGAFHFLFKPSPLLSFRINCDTNGTFLSSRSRVFDGESEIYSTYYLIDTLGLSPESAERMTKEVRLKSVENADAVIALFRDYGFTSDHMADIFYAFPKLLNSNPAQTLKPKLDCFVVNGISGDLLHRALVSDPHILRISLHRRIAPCFDLLNGFYDDENGVASLFALRRGTWVLRNFSATTASNVETLLRHGVPKHCIAKLFTVVPSLSRPNEDLEETVREVKELGFDPSSTKFVRAVRAFSAVNKERREAKLELFKKFGWTEQQIQSLVMRRPQYLSLSVEKLRESLEFFMTKHRWSADDITRHFQLLTLSLDNRISPRYTVLEILASRGLVETGGFVTAFQVTEAIFLEKFVKRYEQDLPNLQQVYDGTMTS